MGSPFEISIRELAHKVSKIIGYKGEIRWNTNMPDGTPRKKLDTSRCDNLGWRASINIDEGVNLTYKKYLEDLNRGSLRN